MGRLHTSSLTIYRTVDGPPGGGVGVQDHHEQAGLLLFVGAWPWAAASRAAAAASMVHHPWRWAIVWWGSKGSGVSVALDGSIDFCFGSSDLMCGQGAAGLQANVKHPNYCPTSLPVVSY
jgi:hypothetical protein